jgi:hypothetical protein
VLVYLSRELVSPTGSETNFTVNVNGSAAPVQLVSLDPTNASILRVKMQTNIKNSQTATITYAGNKLVSTDGYVVDGFGPRDVSIYKINFIKNGEFETGDLTSWELSWDNKGVVQVNTDALKKGAFGVYTNNTIGFANFRTKNGVIPVGAISKGKTYRLTFDLKLPQNTGAWAGGFAHIVKEAGGWSEMGGQLWFGATNTNWQTIVFDKPGADWGTLSDIYVEFTARDGKQPFYIDNIELFELEL